MTPERQDQYASLIEDLLRCENGQEPEVLDAKSELIDADFLKMTMQVATHFAHQGNQESAKFLFHITRELAKQLELYPQV